MSSEGYDIVIDKTRRKIYHLVRSGLKNDPLRLNLSLTYFKFEVKHSYVHPKTKKQENEFAEMLVHRFVLSIGFNICMLIILCVSAFAC